MILALNQDYNADTRVIIPFQISRVVVLTIPVLAGIISHITGSGGAQSFAQIASSVADTESANFFSSIIRLLIIFLVLPFIIPYVVRKKELFLKGD